MDQKDASQNLFRINLGFKGPLKRKLLTPSTRLLEKLLLLDHVDRIYKGAVNWQGEGDFMSKVLAHMNVTYSLSEADRARFPKTGRAVVVANHPYGGIESVILCALLKSVRPDSKVLANYLLKRVPETRDFCIFVDPFGGRKSKRANIGPIKEAARLLKDNGMLGVFPSGEVAHISLLSRGVVDPPWNTTIARIIRMTESPVVPMFIEGSNGPFFQVAGLIHPRLRTAMLPRELSNKRNRTIKVVVGNMIPYSQLEQYSTDTELMDYLRFRTFVLANRTATKEEKKRRIFLRRKPRREEPVAAPEDPDLMQAEVERLSAEQKVVENLPLQVYIANASQIRHVLFEIGRLREIAFREEHEGTGKSMDLDRFDNHYLHLFVWNRDTKEVVGAYRLGQTDDILARFGKKGLYTSTLVRYRKTLLNRITPALEMGRSFVRLEYQKSYAPLLLLWKGIGQYVVRNPRYTKLFGPVSISSEYRSVSRRLLATYLTVNNYEVNLARLIKAKHPLRRKPIKGCVRTVFDKAVRDLDAISGVISDLEDANRGVPILLKQYLKLGGKLLGFSVDPDFGNVLDGLILVDLIQLLAFDPRQMQRFMGKEGVAKFVAFNGKDLPPTDDIAGSRTGCATT